MPRLSDDRLAELRRIYVECDEYPPARDDLRALLDDLADARQEIARLHQCLDTWERCAGGTEKHVEAVEAECARLREREVRLLTLHADLYARVHGHPPTYPGQSHDERIAPMFPPPGPMP